MKFKFHLTTQQILSAGLIICLAVTIVAYFWATGLISSLYAFRSPLKNSPPQPGSSLGQPATRKVVFVLIDALRLDTSLQAATMPTLNHLRQQGASATMHSRPLSFSEPGYSSLLIGAWPEINDGPAANLDYTDIPTWTQDNLFSAASRAGLRTAVSGYNWFEKLIPQNAVSASFYTAGEDQQADRAVVDAALPWLGQDFRLVLIHIDQVDYAGHHEGGPISPNWAAAAQRADDLLAEILAKIDLSRDTVLVCSDHGQIDPGGHGGTEPVVLTEPFVLAGAGVKPGSFGDIQMVDVAPTLAALLGTNLPAASQGQPLQAMLNLPAATLAALPKAIAAQQTNLLIDYTNMISRPIAPAELPQGADVAVYQKMLEAAISERLYLERVPRWLTFGFLVLLGIGLVSRLKLRPLAWSFGPALISIAVFHFRYAVLDGHAYSLSWVPGQMELILYIALTTAIGWLPAWLVAMFGQSAFRQNRLSAAQTSLGFSLAMLVLVALPVAVSYSLNGFTTGWTLPDIPSYFIALLSLIQALVSAVLGLLLTGLTAVLGRR